MKNKLLHWRFNKISFTQTMQEIGISELKKIAKVVNDKYGYDFSNYAISSFKRRIGRILEVKRISNIDNLIGRIENDEFTRDELLSEITVNVTEMFRDPSFWRTLKSTIPILFQNQDKIRIWHAGCSSGEEVYSMLILLKEMNVLHKSEIIASDIDSVILSRAKQGKVNMRNMELNQKNYIRYSDSGDLMSYFKIDKDNAVLDKSLIQSVSFREIDLVKAAPFSKFDLVLCRNVLIYFNQALQNEVTKLICQSLFKYGYLAVGSKESIMWTETCNKFIIANNEEKIYKKIKD